MLPKLNVVPFVSVDNMMKLVLSIGVERFLAELAEYIAEDFRRWHLFDKTPRVRVAFKRGRDRTDAHLGRHDLRVQIRERSSEEHARGSPDGDGPSASWPMSGTAIPCS